MERRTVEVLLPPVTKGETAWFAARRLVRTPWALTAARPDEEPTMSDDINRPMPLAASGRRGRRIRIPIVSLLVFIISSVVAAPAAAAGKTVDGGTVVHATALWSGVDGQG